MGVSYPGLVASATFCYVNIQFPNQNLCCLQMIYPVRVTKIGNDLLLWPITPVLLGDELFGYDFCSWKVALLTEA